MSAPSSRCGAVVSQSEKARNANSFFERITALLDDESVKTTNRDDVDPQLRGQMRLATDHLQQMIRFARKFHQYRFSDDPLRCEKAGEAAWMLVQLHNKLHRGEVGTEFLKMVTLFDRRAKLTPQPDFFGFHHKSWAGVVNKIMLQHYCPFDDAFEASASPDGDTEDEQGIEESESSLWTPEAFSLLCQRLDEDPLQILSFTKSSWGVEQEPGKKSARDNAAGGQGEAGGKQSKGKKTGHRRNSEELFRAALRTHHQYETGGSVLELAPISTRQIEVLTKTLISDSTAGRLLKKHFGSAEKYREACISGAIGMKLVVLLGDGLHAFGTFDATENDSEDAAENDSAE